MIGLFVFDLGNVIVPFETRQIAVKLHEVSRIQDGFTPDDLFRFLFDRVRGLVNPYEEGLMSSLDFSRSSGRDTNWNWNLKNSKTYGTTFLRRIPKLTRLLHI